MLTLIKSNNYLVKQTKHYFFKLAKTFLEILPAKSVFNSQFTQVVG